MLDMPTRIARAALLMSALGGLCTESALGAKLVTVTVDTVPSGARVEMKGNTIGTTPFRAQYPKTYFRGPKTLFSKRLTESVVLTSYKDDYYPKTVEVTHGPFLWQSLNGQNSFIFYTLDESYVVHLEAIPGSIPSEEPANATESHGTALHCGHHGYLVTNYHVVEQADVITVSRGEHRCEAKLVGSDRANDLAILLVPDDCIGRLGLADPPPLGQTRHLQQGEEVVTYGYPLPTEFAGEPQVSSGIVKSTAGLRDPRTLTISNSVQPGNSGGPLLASDGGVVGVVTSTLSAKYLYPRYEALPQDLNFAVKSEYVRLLFDLNGIVAEPNKQELDAIAELTGAADQPVSTRLPEFVSRIRSSVLLVTAERQ